MNDFSNYIYEAPSMLDETKCKYLIQYFENNTQLYKKNANCIEINNTLIDDPKMYEFINEITNIFDTQFKIYFSNLSNLYNIHQHKFVTSQICVEKQIKERQIISKNKIQRSSMGYMFFLNDIENGGEICFLNNKPIKAESGKLLFFPIEWFFTFKENIPMSNDKYILHGTFSLCE